MNQTDRLLRLCRTISFGSSAIVSLASCSRKPKRESDARGSIMSTRAPRIAFKAKGRILFLDLAEVVAVQAEGNYVSLRHLPNPYLLHDSLSSMAETLKPYGFIIIHRSVVVNCSAFEEIQLLP